MIISKSPGVKNTKMIWHTVRTTWQACQKKSQQFTPNAAKQRICRIPPRTLQSVRYFTSIYTKKIWTLNHWNPLSYRLTSIFSKVIVPYRSRNYNKKRRSQDLQEGSVTPPQQTAIIMYRSTTIKHVNRALSQLDNLQCTELEMGILIKQVMEIWNIHVAFIFTTFGKHKGHNRVSKIF